MENIRIFQKICRKFNFKFILIEIQTQLFLQSISLDDIVQRLNEWISNFKPDKVIS